MHSQSRMMRGLHSNRTRGRKARREGGGNQDNPRDEQPIRSVFENDEVLFRRRSHAPLSQTCTAGACACSCKSRRAPRPRKPDGKLSRHGLGARRVALLAPRGVLSKYRHPLSYVGAIIKILVKFKSQSRILGDGKPIPSGGGVP